MRSVCTMHEAHWGHMHSNSNHLGMAPWPHAHGVTYARVTY